MKLMNGELLMASQASEICKYASGSEHYHCEKVPFQVDYEEVLE